MLLLVYNCELYLSGTVKPYSTTQIQLEMNQAHRYGAFYKFLHGKLLFLEIMTFTQRKKLNKYIFSNIVI